MAVESVTVVAPEVRVGAFILSKGTWHEHTTDTRSFVTYFTSLHFWSSTGLVEQINNFQTLSLKDFTAPDLDPFLSIHDDYFYHTQTPRKPEVSMLMWTPTWTHLWPFKCLAPHIVQLRSSVFLSVFVFLKGWGRACKVLLCWTERWDIWSWTSSNCKSWTWSTKEVPIKSTAPHIFK